MNASFIMAEYVPKTFVEYAAVEKQMLAYTTSVPNVYARSVDECFKYLNTVATFKDVFKDGVIDELDDGYSDYIVAVTNYREIYREKGDMVAFQKLDLLLRAMHHLDMECVFEPDGRRFEQAYLAARPRIDPRLLRSYINFCRYIYITAFGFDPAHVAVVFRE